MKSRKLWIGIGLFTLASLGAARLGSADPPGRGERPRGHLEQMAARLELTDEQRAKVEEIREAGEVERTKLEKEAMKARHELRGEFLKDEPDRKRVRALVQQIGDIRTKMEIQRAEHRLTIRDLLTPEQRDRFVTMGGPRGVGAFGPRGPMKDCRGDRDRRGERGERRERFPD